MNKLKELWGKNKVLIVLGFILIICLIAILIVTFSFFFGGSKSVYGNRLKDIDKHPISESFKSEYITNLTNDETITSVNFDIRGRIIYININFVGDIALVEAESKAAGSLTTLGDDIMSYYDIIFTLKSEATENSEGFIMLGAKNATGTGLVWNNNTPVESDE